MLKQAKRPTQGPRGLEGVLGLTSFWALLGAFDRPVQGSSYFDDARQGKARQGKARQPKTPGVLGGSRVVGDARQGKARQGKARQGNPRPQGSWGGLGS